jgi:hypothetical protein
VREGGEITGRVAVGSGSLSYACALGGDDGRTLFVCTAPTWAEGGPRAGRIEVAPVDVPGGRNGLTPSFGQRRRRRAGHGGPRRVRCQPERGQSLPPDAQRTR